MFPQTSHNTIHRLPKRAHYDTETIYAILDEGLICHVAFTDGDQPVVIPTLYGRSGDTIYLHGAKASRMLKQIDAGHPISIAVTLVDGIVFARSVFHHSINYRSVVLFGHGQLIEEAEAKLHALEVLTEHIARGRWSQ
ncbi:MAG TPA: pyridoxamine 5'-phosphate oxidase family protein, partial [Aggregatilineaceae bacterium]|nr:pyridoxamine 5'-phosphate oxidase family protein [Aggregatilineaceae bacterium]